jgi:hypothetical protein
LQADYWSDAALEQRMANGWTGGLPYTPCGNGTLPVHTANAKRWLPHIIEKYQFNTIVDAGAGDLTWIRDALDGSDVIYWPFDLVPRAANIEKADIARDRLPNCDVILCRHVLIHLDPERIQKALSLFRQAAPYLIASQYDVFQDFDPDKQYNRTNLAVTYGLGKPLESVQDGKEPACSLALWKI